MDRLDTGQKRDDLGADIFLELDVQEVQLSERVEDGLEVWHAQRPELPRSEFVDPAIGALHAHEIVIVDDDRYTTIADLGSHLIDMALWMVGPIAAVSAQSETFIATRQGPLGEQPVTIDDASSALIRFEGGARGTVEMARLAVRRPCDFTVEVNGSTGTLVFDYPRMNELRYGDAGDDPGLYGMRRIRAEHPSHPYAAQWWPIGQGIGYGASLVNQAVDLLTAWPSGTWTPSFADGLAVQAVCDAMEVSARDQRWVRVAEVTGVAQPGADLTRP